MKFEYYDRAPDYYKLYTNSYRKFWECPGELANICILAYEKNKYMGGAIFSIYSETSDYRSGGDTRCNHRRSAWIEELDGINFNVMRGLLEEGKKWFYYNRDKIIKHYIYDNSGLRDMKYQIFNKINKETPQYTCADDFFLDIGFKSVNIYSSRRSNHEEAITKTINNYTFFALYTNFRPSLPKEIKPSIKPSINEINQVNDISSISEETKESDVEDMSIPLLEKESSDNILVSLYKKFFLSKSIKLKIKLD